MNTEQKKRAKDVRQKWADYEWSGADSGSEFEVVEIANKMAALLQELIDAPEPEPLTDSFVQTVPDKCDRIVWRGHYYHLKEGTGKPAPSVPVLTVECEPDYWSGGHYHEGTMPYIDPTAVWKLPIGTKLYTAQTAPSVPDADLVRDAERYRWLRESNWYVGPDDFYADEAGGLENYQNENFSAENLDTKIDAAIERELSGENKE